MKNKSFTRRGFLAGTVLLSPLVRKLHALELRPAAMSRSEVALDLRKQAALAQSKRPVDAMIANGDEN